MAGGAAVPPLTGAVGDLHGMGIAMVIPMTFFALAMTYALSVNFAPRYRDVADAFTVADIGTEGDTIDEEKVKQQGEHTEVGMAATKAD